MGDIFAKFKNKVLIIRSIKSVMSGVAFSALVTGVLILLTKLEIWELGDVHYWIIGISSLSLVSVVTYFLLRVSDKSLAQKIDGKYSLNEKVQTMLAYKNSDGAMVQLQREDANKALQTVGNGVVGIKRIWIYALCFLVGIAVLVLSLIYTPAEEEPPPVVEIPFEVSQLQISALTELSLYVSNSEMQSPYKENVVSSIDGLIDKLKAATTVSQRDEALDEAVDTIFKETSDSSSALELINELWKTEKQSAKLLAKALNYYDWPKADEWDKFVDKMEEFRSAFIYVSEENGSETSDADSLDYVKTVLTSIITSIDASLDNAKVPKEDALYIALVRLAHAKEENEELGTHVYGFSNILDISDTVGYSDLQREIDSTFTALNSVLFASLSQHSSNTGTGEYALTRISSLFDYDIPAFERPQLYDFSYGDSSDGDGAGGTMGGIGNGTVYGSDDLVYDPDTNKYVEYGVILDKYYSIMFNKTQSEEYTEEEKKAMEKYFDILYGGFDEENE